MEVSLSSLKKFKAVLFDLDGTLRLNLPPAGEVFADYVKSLGVEFSEAERIRSEHWEYEYFASSPEVKADTEIFKDDLKGFWVNFTKRRLLALGLQEERSMQLAPQVSDYMDTSFNPQAFAPEEIFPLLKFLQEDGYTLGVVSNREDPFHEELEKLNLSSYFQFTLAGGEVNSYKPEPLIFQRALELAGTSAAETIYVGDNYFADVIGALRSGLTPVLYDPTSLFAEAADGCAVIKNYSEFYGLLN